MYFTAIILIPSNVATDTEYDAPYQPGTGPTIDGTINSAEWANSTPVELIFQFDEGDPTIRVDFYALHNGTALFIGLNITLADTGLNDSDAFIIYFDENHNGQLNATGSDPNEEGLQVLRNTTVIDLCYNESKWKSDELGLSTGATNGIGEWEFVFIYSTNKSDFNVNLPSNVLEPEKTIGIDIEYYNADVNMTDSCTTAANTTRSLNPEDWDDLVCGRLPEPTPNLDAIWAYIIIAMIIPAGVIFVLFIVLYRKKTD